MEISLENLHADFGSYRVKQNFFYKKLFITNKIELLPNDSCKSSQSFVAITSNLNSYDIKLIKVKITCINNQDLNNRWQSITINDNRYQLID